VLLPFLNTGGYFMNKVINVGSLNMDIVVEVKKIPIAGETVLASSMEKFHGGKGANQAVATARFGAETHMIGSVGNDEHGKMLLENLKSNGVNIAGVKTLDGENSGTAFITVDQNGENFIMVVSGANMKLDRKDIDENRELFCRNDVVLLQLEVPQDTVKYAIETGKEKGCKIILNPAPAVKLDRDILSKVDIITPNESELDILTGGIKESDMIKKAEKLLESGVQNVVCTLGEKGVLLVNKDGNKQFPAYRVHAIDTTGAGDCFSGVLAAALSGGRSIEDAIKYAVKASSISVTRKGAQVSMPYRNEVEI
jgi:ribokinase